MATENNAVPGSHCVVKQLEGWFKSRRFKQAGKRSCLCYLTVFINENDLAHSSVLRRGTKQTTDEVKC